MRNEMKKETDCQCTSNWRMASEIPNRMTGVRRIAAILYWVILYKTAEPGVAQISPLHHAGDAMDAC
jgi:hypothetical protein